MSAEVQQLLRPVSSHAQGSKVPGPSDAGFAQAFADLLAAEDLVDGGAIARARRAAEAKASTKSLISAGDS